MTRPETDPRGLELQVCGLQANASALMLLCSCALALPRTFVLISAAIPARIGLAKAGSDALCGATNCNHVLQITMQRLEHGMGDGTDRIGFSDGGDRNTCSPQLTRLCLWPYVGGRSYQRGTLWQQQRNMRPKQNARRADSMHSLVSTNAKCLPRCRPQLDLSGRRLGTPANSRMNAKPWRQWMAMARALPTADRPGRST